jgi:hypothetical protein
VLDSYAIIRCVKRVQLFEFEDLPWFPSWIRNCITRYIAVVHQLLGTREALTPLIRRLIEMTPSKKLIDLCSGAGGPLPEVARELKAQGLDFELTMSDLYPNLEAAQHLASSGIQYEETPVDATSVQHDGARILICSFHHMKPDRARAILKNAHDEKKPLCIFEISDNGLPLFLFWLTIPAAFLMVLVLTPMIRPMTWQQIIFTYFVPLIPLFVAWDAAISNIRTYTLSDMEELTAGLDDAYAWESGAIESRAPGKMLYLLGQPSSGISSSGSLRIFPRNLGGSESTRTAELSQP